MEAQECVAAQARVIAHTYAPLHSYRSEEEACCRKYNNERHRKYNNERNWQTKGPLAPAPPAPPCRTDSVLGCRSPQLCTQQQWQTHMTASQHHLAGIALTCAAGAAVQDGLSAGVASAQHEGGGVAALRHCRRKARRLLLQRLLPGRQHLSAQYQVSLRRL